MIGILRERVCLRIKQEFWLCSQLLSYTDGNEHWQNRIWETFDGKSRVGVNYYRHRKYSANGELRAKQTNSNDCTAKRGHADKESRDDLFRISIIEGKNNCQRKEYCCRYEKKISHSLSPTLTCAFPPQRGNLHTPSNPHSSEKFLRQEWVF